MTTHLAIFLAALLATQVVPTQAAPGTAPASDLPRVEKIFAAPIAAYAQLRSYSGRFSSTDPESGDTAIGTIQFARPNLLAMQTQAKEGSLSYTRRMVCDGRFLWALDSRFKGRYTKEKVWARSVGGVMAGSLDAAGLDLSLLLMGHLPLYLRFDPAPVRIVSKPGAPVLIVDKLLPSDPDLPSAENKRRAHFKMTFRFGPDNLLRGSTAPRDLYGITDKSERHWDIKLNPTLPASTFTFKPAPGARQIRDFSYLYEDS